MEFPPLVPVLYLTKASAQSSNELQSSSNYLHFWLLTVATSKCQGPGQPLFLSCLSLTLSAATTAGAKLFPHCVVGGAASVESCWRTLLLLQVPRGGRCWKGLWGSAAELESPLPCPIPKLFSARTIFPGQPQPHQSQMVGLESPWTHPSIPTATPLCLCTAASPQIVKKLSN